MDEEARRISEMPDEELEARWNAGTPTKVKRKPRADLATTAKRMMDAVIERTEEPETEHRKGGEFGRPYFVRLHGVRQSAGT